MSENRTKGRDLYSTFWTSGHSIFVILHFVKLMNFWTWSDFGWYPGIGGFGVFLSTYLGMVYLGYVCFWGVYFCLFWTMGNPGKYMVCYLFVIFLHACFVVPYFVVLRYCGIVIWGCPFWGCLLYTSPSPRDYAASRMPSSA